MNSKLVRRIIAWRHYEPVVVHSLEAFLRSGRRGSGAANFSLRILFGMARRAIAYKRSYVAKNRKNVAGDSLPATGGSANSENHPWNCSSTSVKHYQHGDRILIIAELSMSQCKKYRVDQKVAMLRHLGISSTVLSWTDALSCLDAIQTSTAVIFYRTPAFPLVKDLVCECKRLGLITFFDIDDLVFDLSEYSKNKNVTKLPEAEKKLLLDGAAFYKEMLTLADHGIASTAVIAEHMRHECRGSVFILENCLDDHLIDLSNEMSTVSMDHKPWIDIGYGSGTTTHDADFEIVAKALEDVLDSCPKARLLIYGPLNIGDTFRRFGERLVQVPFIAADDYYRSLARFDISIAPLEKSVFNDAKSNIKYIEASVFGVPSVCSPGATFQQVISHGDNGFLANTHNEWKDALIDLVNDAGLRRQVGASARDAVLNKYQLASVAQRQMLPVTDVGLNRSGGETKRRILVVNLLFAPVSFGGATIVAEQLALGLATEPGTEVMVFSGNWNAELRPYAVRAYEWNGVPVVTMRLPDGGPREQEYLHPQAGAVFSDVLAAFRPDIVHFHSIQGMATSLLDSCRIAKVPFVVTLHDAWWICERQFMVRGDGCYCYQKAVDPAVCSSCVPDPAYTYRRYYYLRKMLHSAARLLAPSTFHRNLYIASGFSEGTVAVNRNGVVRPNSMPKRIPDKQLTFAYLGGRATHKGYFWLKEVMEGIVGEKYSLKLVDIESRFGVSGMMADKWLMGGRLEIVPPFDPSEIDGFFSDIDVLLFPSQWKESFGLSVREALIRNVWVISTDCGGPVEDIHPGENGDLVAINDLKGFRQAVQRLVDAPQLLNHYRNPYSDEVRLFPEQVEELSALFDEILRHSVRPQLVCDQQVSGNSNQRY